MATLTVPPTPFSPHDDAIHLYKAFKGTSFNYSSQLHPFSLHRWINDSILNDDMIKIWFWSTPSFVFSWFFIRTQSFRFDLGQVYQFHFCWLQSGFGCDTAAVINILAHRDATQRAHIQHEFQRMYSEDILKRLSSELSGKLEVYSQVWLSIVIKFQNWWQYSS